MTKTNWTKKILLGKVDGEKIWLSPPSWDCGWYWGFGYLGNKNCHYHLDSLDDHKNNHLFDRIKEHFDIGTLFLANDEELWKFCELVLSAYQLIKSAEFFGRGGSHCTTNPLAEKIKDITLTAKINNELLPAIFDELQLLFERQEEVKKEMLKKKKQELKEKLKELKTEARTILKTYNEFNQNK